MMKKKIKIGISACLLGEKVRYNGEHKRNSFIIQTFSSLVEFLPICPEVEVGFGAPREPMQLVGDPQSPRLMTLNSEKDLTDPMLQWTKERIKSLTTENLDGFIFKSKSPSCGISDIKIYSKNEAILKKGTGLFARAFIDHFSLIPVEDEKSLQDPLNRERFFKRIQLDLS